MTTETPTVSVSGGLRRSLPTAHTANDNYRILFLGDSFVEGRQVKTESLFTSRLEKKLDRDGQGIEVINGGVPSTGTPYQYVLWKEFFEPNI